MSGSTTRGIIGIITLLNIIQVALCLLGVFLIATHVLLEAVLFLVIVGVSACPVSRPGPGGLE